MPDHVKVVLHATRRIADLVFVRPGRWRLRRAKKPLRLCRVEAQDALTSWEEVKRDAAILAALWNANLNQNGDALGDDRQTVPADSYAILWLGALVDRFTSNRMDDLLTLADWLNETVPEAHRKAWYDGPGRDLIDRLNVLLAEWNRGVCPGRCPCKCHEKGA